MRLLLILLPLSVFAQTKSEVKREIFRQGIKCPEVVTAQCYYETGHLKSNRCIYDHNLFGMKEATQRTTTALGTRKEHAYYKNWKRSIADYKLWQDKYYKGGDYYEFLENYGYATSKVYIETLKQIKI